MSIIDTPSHAKCLATTGTTFCKTIEQCNTAWSAQPRRHGRDNGRESNLFREAQFSSDGTMIVTHNEDQCLRTFLLPTGLLDESEQAHALSAHSTAPSPSNLHSYATYPYFDLRDPATTLVLSASADQPITLSNALDYSTIHAKYQHVSPTTEEYIRSNSLAFSRDGRHFVAGSRNQISIFDCSRDTSGPSSFHRTGANRKARQQYGKPSIGCQGIVSALSISGDGVLAAGTTEREVGLYANEGRGECITAFALAERGAVACGKTQVHGTGITSLKWSPCGKYLCIAERQCDSIQVYDVRNTMQWVSQLTGRQADTTQKLGVDIVTISDGYEVWAGGTDGCVRMWSNPGSQGGEHTPDGEMKLHNDPVSSAIWHPSGAVLATSSGQRFPLAECDDSSSSESDEDADNASNWHSQQWAAPDNKLNIWNL
ncbi:hypothetical protein LTR36_004242 [Oleoguttula mirabilis]|uniref:WD40 repeat-like protein n=1 Tax=Oleoguttula mirabilis TaxID=1507867 RepID=A0AAV9JIL8_9PEZI|nr:hypothetical protein LTR36_004242 [Oleoguttula mirabilis]